MWLVMGNRGGTSSGAFDEVFCSGAIRVVTTPPAGAAGDAIVERFVRTIRAECLDWLLFGLAILIPVDVGLRRVQLDWSVIKG